VFQEVCKKKHNVATGLRGYLVLRHWDGKRINHSNTSLTIGDRDEGRLKLEETKTKKVSLHLFPALGILFAGSKKLTSYLLL